MKIRREVIGDAHVDRAKLNSTSFDADFQEFITRYAWGDAWQRGTVQPSANICALGSDARQERRP
jgi:alkylhydroperoxidase/carboxymuconolactone decarboxylase family protein YurZ